jgi:hypothetical protein
VKQEKIIKRGQIKRIILYKGGAGKNFLARARAPVSLLSSSLGVRIPGLKKKFSLIICKL